jgi:hypothetical protein
MVCLNELGVLRCSRMDRQASCQAAPLTASPAIIGLLLLVVGAWLPWRMCGRGDRLADARGPRSFDVRDSYRGRLVRLPPDFTRR